MIFGYINLFLSTYIKRAKLTNFRIARIINRTEFISFAKADSSYLPRQYVAASSHAASGKMIPATSKQGRDAFIGRKTTLGIHDNEGVAKYRRNDDEERRRSRERREIQSLVEHTRDIP